MLVTDIPTIGAPPGLTETELGRWRDAVDLGRAAALGNAAALRDITSENAAAVVDDRGVRLYIDQEVFGEVTGAHPTYLRRLRGKERLIEPEVRVGMKVGRVWGWGIARAVMWGIEYGYLDEHCAKIERRAGRAGAVSTLDLSSRPHWRRDVVGYLTQDEAGKFLGVTGDSIYQARMRASGPREAVRIVSICGWDPDKLREYNARRPPVYRMKSTEPGAPSA